MPVIEWDESLSVGDEEMDRHHRRLLEMLCRLHAVMRTVDANTAVGQVLADLLAYTEFHFDEEEKCMRRVGFPRLEAHRESHAALTGAVLSMKADYDQEPGSLLAEELFEFLSDWLLRHIKAEDMAYKPYMLKAN
ncbi:bacteriohemerythrin [Paramagnetospirillum marisnigri]|uniref:bacteriohemerythrin n=1 Tax=Paramagnetospirillum marisnigri TaxID=1285242 RepID=UPI00155FB453|nr:bacteriohemerythrin [Paramagnetospirillum marisnigri]